MFTIFAADGYSSCVRAANVRVHLHIHMRMHVPHMATTLEIWSALPHSGLIRQSLVRRQHLGQLLPELSLDDALCLTGWGCLVSGSFSSHFSLAPFPMMQVEWEPLELRRVESVKTVTRSARQRERSQ